jgi:signal transduction histidine kinase
MSNIWNPPTAVDLAELPEHNPNPVCRLELDGTVSLANLAARRLLSLPDTLGTRWADVCPAMSEEQWQAVLADREPVSHEVEVAHRHVIFTFVRSSTGRFVFVYGSDITERRLAERKVAEQAARLAELARFPEMNPGPVLRLDFDGVILLANAAARGLLGDNVIGQSWLTVCPFVSRTAWSQILNAGEHVRVEGRIGDGEYIFVHRCDPPSGLVFVYGSDVTDQRRAERALRQSEKMATLGTLAAGVAHELNNPAAAARRAAEHLRAAFDRHECAHTALHRQSLAAAAQELVQRLARDARAKATEPVALAPIERSDREAEVEAWMEAQHLAIDCDLPAALVSLGLDPASLSRLAASIGTEALPALLASTAGAFQVHALLHEIDQGSTRISEIVGALKGYSYLDQGPVQTVDLHQGLNDTLVILNAKLKHAIDVRRDYDREVPKVQAHGGELNQVWTNLIDNAVQAMGGQGTITIMTRRLDPWVIVEIEDSGPGIPEAIQPRIFDPFFTTKPPGQGTGLGLATCYTIVTEKHHGRISVSSRPGCTKFTVRLPLHAMGATGPASI